MGSVLLYHQPEQGVWRVFSLKGAGMWGPKEEAFLLSVLMGGWRPGWATPKTSLRGQRRGAPIPGLELQLRTCQPHDTGNPL